MRRKRLRIASIFLVVIIILIIAFTIATYNKELNIRMKNINNIGMKIKVDDKTYIVKLSNNDTTYDILKTLPIQTDMVKYEESLYIVRLYDKIEVDGERVNDCLKNNIYYHPGWNSLVIVYKDYTFSKIKLIHIGAIGEFTNNDNSIKHVLIDTNPKD